MYSDESLDMEDVEFGAQEPPQEPPVTGTGWRYRRGFRAGRVKPPNQRPPSRLTTGSPASGDPDPENWRETIPDSSFPDDEQNSQIRRSSRLQIQGTVRKRGGR
jgi:hypothetical protein